MNRRHRRNESGEDLADINEQELAKDGNSLSGLGQMRADEPEDTAKDAEKPSEQNSSEESDTTVKEAEETADATEAQASDVSENADGSEGSPTGEGYEDSLPAPVEEVTDVCSVVPSESDDTAEGSAEETDQTEIEADTEAQAEKKTQKEPPKKKSKRRGRGYVFIICACFLASVALLIFTVIGDRADSEENAQSADSSQALTDTDADTDGDAVSSSLSVMSTGALYEKCSESAVSVVARGDNGESYSSGFAIFSDGYIATLYEGVADADSISVILSDGSEHEARLVGGDATVNLALLQTSVPTLSCVSVGGSSELYAGSELYAIGSMGEGSLCASLVSCQVSYAGRSALIVGADGVTRKVNTVQISGLSDAELKGCAVFDPYGNAVGIVFDSCADSSVGFFIPLEGAKAVLESIMRGEELSEEVIGAIAYIPAALGIFGEQAQTEDGSLWGVCIRSFTDENSDAALKLRVGDIIFKIDDTLTPDTASLSSKVQSLSAGQITEVFVYRNGQRLSFYVTLTKN